MLCSEIPSSCTLNNGICFPNGTWSCCGQGTYISKVGEGSCVSCPRGYYGNGSQTCTPCPTGTYTNRTGSSSCDPCPVGYYTNNLNSTSCLACKSCTDPNTAVVYQCPLGSMNDSSKCSCISGFYGVSTNPFISCTQCPTHTTSTFGNTETVLTCRCLQGFYCSYTKRINVVLKIMNLTVPIDKDNIYLNDFIYAIAAAAGVPFTNVNVIAIEPIGNLSTRRLMKVSNQETLSQEKSNHNLIFLSISGATYVDSTAIPKYSKNGIIELISWEHKHALRVFKHSELK